MRPLHITFYVAYRLRAHQKVIVLNYLKVSFESFTIINALVYKYLNKKNGLLHFQNHFQFLSILENYATIFQFSIILLEIMWKKMQKTKKFICYICWKIKF